MHHPALALVAQASKMVRMRRLAFGVRLLLVAGKGVLLVQPKSRCLLVVELSKATLEFGKRLALLCEEHISDVLIRRVCRIGEGHGRGAWEGFLNRALRCGRRGK